MSSLIEKHPQIIGGLLALIAGNVFLAILGFIGFTFEQAILIMVVIVVFLAYGGFQYLIYRKPKKEVEGNEQNVL